jgi:hypothetical protein
MRGLPDISKVWERTSSATKIDSQSVSLNSKKTSDNRKKRKLLSGWRRKTSSVMREFTGLRHC